MDNQNDDKYKNQKTDSLAGMSGIGPFIYLMTVIYFKFFLNVNW